ncbi:hypothetical protein AB0M31_41795 [Streptomyces sp. NPDC051773]|uniref:hypothetical protein n=1 Tax=Streptomyces sp. NPDC051773 TaxID=3156682 RepID=UPI00343E0027
MQTLKRRLTALATALGLGLALSVTTGVTPAHAQPRLTVSKTHEGTFTRGGQGTYVITVQNLGDEPTEGLVRITDTYPQGLTSAGVSVTANNIIETPGDGCPFSETGFICDFRFDVSGFVEIEITVDVAPDTPCTTLTNTVTVSSPEDNIVIQASDPTPITGATCPNGNGGGGGIGSILPVNLNGVIPLFNNISTNDNINSPGGSNQTNQNQEINAP